MDMRLGVGKRTVPLVLWGNVDLGTDVIDMQVSQRVSGWLHPCRLPLTDCWSQ